MQSESTNVCSRPTEAVAASQYGRECSGEAMSFAVDSLANGPERYSLSWPGHLAGQRLEFITLASGVSMCLGDVDLKQPFTARFNIDASNYFFLSFMLSGHTDFYYDGQQPLTESRQQPCCRYVELHEGNGNMHYGAHEPSKMVGLGFDSKTIHGILGDDAALLPGFGKNSRTGSRTHYKRIDPISIGMRMAAHRAFTCLATAPLRHLFLESMCLELMSLYCLKLEHQRRGHSPRSDIATPADREKVHMARDILHDELATAPTIASLSRRVGTNESKLKSLFKAEFGNTIFGYVHDLRMRRARDLIEGGMSVCEAATTLGYVNFSHFSAIFRKYHGVLPGTLKHQR